jgi:hypothetical protein
MRYTPQELFKLPDHKRRRVRFFPELRGKNRRIERPRRTAEELVAFLREHNIRSIRQVEKILRDGDPTISDYRLGFDKWSDAKKLAFGEERVIPCNDPEYMAKLLIEFTIKTRDRYREVRRLRPDIVPSIVQVKRKWGGFGRLKYVLRSYSVREALDAYLKLTKKLGRIPYRVECREHGIDIGLAISFFGKKKKLDNFLIGLGGNK